MVAVTAPSAPVHLLDLNPDLDRPALAAEFARNGRIQIRNVLKDISARELRSVLMRATPWGLAWHAGEDGPHGMRAEEFAALAQAKRQQIGNAVMQASARSEYAFWFARYPLLDAYLERWMPDSAHDILFEHINSDPFLDLVRQVTAIPELVKADAQATLYAPNHFLGPHNDSHVAEEWRVAYVLNLTIDDWQPDWGGYLNFLDDDGDIVAGYRPRFNSLNMFAVPQRHHVSYVPPFAPIGRFAITGWLRTK